MSNRHLEDVFSFFEEKKRPFSQILGELALRQFSNKLDHDWEVV